MSSMKQLARLRNPLCPDNFSMKRVARFHRKYSQWIVSRALTTNDIIDYSSRYYKWPEIKKAQQDCKM